jgi:hypothetical protein
MRTCTDLTTRFLVRKSTPGGSEDARLADL